MARALRIDKEGKLRLTEAEMFGQVEDFLQAHGWRIFKMGYGEIHRGGRVVGTVGEVGMPDRLCIRYGAGSYAEVIWLEGKRAKSKGDSGGRLRDKQLNWIDNEMRLGATICVPRDLDSFAAWSRETIGERSGVWQLTCWEYWRRSSAVTRSGRSATNSSR